MNATQEIKKIFIVPYCHADWAWTLTRRWHEKRYIIVFEEVLDILKSHPDFRWYMDTFITQLEPFLRSRPERYRELRERIANRQIGICGTFTNLRPHMVGEETQIRDIIIGKEKYRELFPEADLSVYAGNVDVSVGHPQIPQVTVLSGYKYLRFWRPHAALSEKKVPLEFFWEGIDGSRILSARGPYGGLYYRTNLSKRFRQELSDSRELSPTGIAWVGQGGDDNRPLRTWYEDKIIPIFDFIEKWNNRENVPLRFATPQEFFEELERHREEIPTVKGSLDLCDVSYNIGWGGSEGLFSLRQGNEINLTECEKWASVASVFGYKYREEEIRKLWENHLLSCAHGTQWTLEEDFEEVYNPAFYVKILSQRMKSDALNFLKNLVTTGDNSEVMIFNSLAFERTEKVSLNISLPKFYPAFSLRDGKGRKVSFQIKDRSEKEGKAWEYRLVAKVKLPPSGYNTISIVRKKSQIKVKKNNFKVCFEGPDIVKIKTGREKYATTRKNPFGNLKLYKVDTKKGGLHVGPISGEKMVKWGKTDIKEDGEIYSRYQSIGNIGKHEIKRDTIIYKDEKRIEFQIEVNWIGEDGFLTLEWPMNFEGKIYGDFPFGVEEKNIENEPYGKFPEMGIERQRKNLFVAKSFVNFTDGRKSVSYLNYDATHYYILFDKSVGNILLNSFTYRPGWERFMNEKGMGEGKHRFVSHMIFHSGDWRRENLSQRAQSLFRKPERICVDKISKGKLSSCHSFFSIYPFNLIVTGFYRQGRSYVLRFYESAGRKTKGRLQFPFVTKQIKKTNLEGETLNFLVPGKTISVEVAPREIVTLKFI